MNFEQLLNERQYDIKEFVKDGVLDLDGVMKKMSGRSSYSNSEKLLKALNDKIKKSEDEKKKIKVKLSKGATAFYVDRKDLKKLTLRINKAFEDGTFSEALWRRFEKEMLEKYTPSGVKSRTLNNKEPEGGFTIQGKMPEMISGIFKNVSFSDYLLNNKEIDFFKSDIKINRKEGGNTYIEVKRTGPREKFPLGQILSIRTSTDWIKFKNKVLEKLEEKKDNPKVKRVLEKLKEDKELLDKYAVILYERSYKSFANNPSSFPGILNRIYTHFTRQGDKVFLVMGLDKDSEVIAPFTKKYVKLGIDLLPKSYAPTSGKSKISRANVTVKFTKDAFEYNKKHNTPENRKKIVEGLRILKKELLND